MQYTLKQLRYVEAVAAAGNITAAAAGLHVAQSAVSTAVSDIETESGLQIFHRHHARGVTLTPSGETFVSHARGLLRHADEFALQARALGNRLAGTLQLGCYNVVAPYALSPVLRAVESMNAEINVEVLEGTIQEMVAAALNGKTELALVYDIDLPDQLEKLIVAKLKPYVLVSTKHPLANTGSIKLESLRDEPMVLLDLPHSRDYFRSLFAGLNFIPQIAFKTQSFETVRSLVASGQGFSVLNFKPNVSKSYEGKRLVTLDIKPEQKPLSLVLVWRRGLRLTDRALACRDSCVKALSSI